MSNKAKAKSGFSALIRCVGSYELSFVAGIALLFLSLFPVPSSHAANSTWTGSSGTTNMSNSADWGGTIPASGNAWIFTSANASASTTLSNDFVANFNVGGFTFNSGSLAFVINGNPINLSGNIVNNSTSLETFGTAFALQQATTFTTLSGGGNLTFNGIISGSYGLTISGSGTTIFAAANSYTGNTMLTNSGAISNNMLKVTNGGVINTTNGMLTVGQGILALGGTGQITVQDLVVTNGNTTNTTNSAFSFAGGTLTTSNSANATASYLNTATNLTSYSVINGTWNMYGGTNFMVTTATGTNKGTVVLIGNGVNNAEVVVNTNAVWVLGLTTSGLSTNGPNNNQIQIGTNASTNSELLVNGGNVTNVFEIIMGLSSATVSNSQLVITNGGQVSVLSSNNNGGVGLQIYGTASSVTIGGTNSSGSNSILNVDLGRIQFGTSLASVTAGDTITIGAGGVVTNANFFAYGTNTTLTLTNGGLWGMSNAGQGGAALGRGGQNNSLYIGSSTSTNSVWNVNGNVYIGGNNANSTNNLLQIDQGGVMTNITSLYVGGQSVSSNLDTNEVGNRFVVTNGGIASNSAAATVYIGVYSNDNSNSIIVAGTNSTNGAGSIWNADSANIVIAYNVNTYNYTITNTGVTSTYTTTVYQPNLINDTLNVLNGGILTNLGTVTIGGTNGSNSFNIYGGTAYANAVNLGTTNTVTNAPQNGSNVPTVTTNTYTNYGVLNFSNNGSTNGVLFATNSGNLIYGAGTVSFKGNGTINNNGFSVTNSAVNAGIGTLTASGIGNLTLTASNSYGGTIITGGTLVVGNNNALGTNTGSLNVAGGTLSIGSYNITEGTVSLGNGTISGSGTLTGSSYNVTNSSNASISANLAGSGNFTNAGTGTTTLSGSSTLTGNTVITSGTLIASAIGSGTFSLNNGSFATTSGSPTLSVGAMSILGSGTIFLTNGIATNFYSAGAVNISGSGNLINLTAAEAPGSTNVIITGSTLAASGISLTGSAVANQIVALGSSVIVGRTTYTLTNDSSTLDLVLGGGAWNLIWAGGGSGNWDTNVATTNWYSASNSASTNNFYSADNVTFTNAATVNVDSGAITAGTINVTNDSGTVTLYGSAITGTAFTNSGLGNLIISNNLSLGGAAFVNLGSGSVVLAGGFSNGSILQNGSGTLDLGGNTYTNSGTPITLSQGTIQNGTITSGSTFTTLTNGVVSATIAGTGGLTESGSGTLILTGSNSYTGTTTLTNTATLVLAGSNNYTGGTVIAGGTLVVSNSFALGASNGSLVINAGILTNGGYNMTVGNFSVGGSGSIIGTGTLIESGGIGTLSSGATITLAQLLVTNGNTGSGITSSFNFTGGSLTTSNAPNAVASTILIASNASYAINGSWTMNGGTNLISPVQTNASGPASSVWIGNVVSNVTVAQVTVNTGAVWSLGTNPIATNSSASTNDMVLQIGDATASSSNSLTVNGGVVTNVQLIFVGDNATASSNSLVITNGGQVYAGFSGSGGTSVINFAGNNSTVTIAGTNPSGGNSIFFGDGGRVSVGSGAGLGYTNDSLTVGQGGVFTNAQIFTYGSNSSLIITNGGQWYEAAGAFFGRQGTNSASYIGSSIPGSNSLFVFLGTGGGNSFNIAGFSPNSLSNSVVVGQGGIVTNVSGSLTVGGQASTDTNEVGNTLVITNGGQFYSTANSANYIGYFTNDNSNSIVVAGTNPSGASSLLNASNGSFFVGYTPVTYTFTITNSGATNTFTNSLYTQTTNNSLNVLTGGVLTNVGTVTIGGTNGSNAFNIYGGSAYVVAVNLGTTNTVTNAPQSGSNIPIITTNTYTNFGLLNFSNNGVLNATTNGNVIYGAGSVTFKGNGTINDATYSVTNSAVNGGAGTMTVAGSGSLTLGASNSYAGTILTGGTLVVANSNALGTNTGTLNVAAGILSVGGYNVTEGAVSLGNGSITGSGTLTGSSFTATNSGIAAITANIVGSGFTQNGAGITTVTGSSLAGNTTINAGALYANSIGGGTLSVSNGVFGIPQTGTGTLSLAELDMLGTGTIYLTNTVVSASGNANISGSSNLINLTASETAGTTNNIITAGTALTTSAGISITGSAVSGQVVALDQSVLFGRTTYTLTNTATQLQLILGGGAWNIFYQTSTGGGWDTNTANTTWYATNSGGTTTSFYSSDNVNFTNAATVDVDDPSGGVTAGAVNVSNNVGSVILFDGSITASSFTNSGSGNLVVSNALSLLGGGAFVNIGSGTVTLAGNFSSGSILQNGFGTLVLSASNTYSGGSTVTAGTLIASNANALGVGTVLVNGGILDLGGNTFSNSVNSFILSSGTIQDGTITNGATFNTLTNGTVSAVLAGAVGLTESGTGTLILSGSNIYTGSTLVSGGTLVLAGSNSYSGTIISSNAVLVVSNTYALGNTAGTLTIASGGTLTNSSFNDTVGAVSVGSGTISGTGTLTGTSFTFTNTGVAYISETLQSATGSLIQSGTGTTILAGSNNIQTAGNALLVNAGTVVLATNNAIYTSATNGLVAVNNGGTLINNAGVTNYLNSTNVGLRSLLIGNTGTGVTNLLTDYGVLVITNGNGKIGIGGGAVNSLNEIVVANGGTFSQTSLFLGNGGTGGTNELYVAAGGTLTGGGPTIGYGALADYALITNAGGTISVAGITLGSVSSPNITNVFAQGSGTSVITGGFSVGNSTNASASNILNEVLLAGGLMTNTSAANFNLGSAAGAPSTGTNELVIGSNATFGGFVTLTIGSLGSQSNLFSNAGSASMVNLFVGGASSNTYNTLILGAGTLSVSTQFGPATATNTETNSFLWTGGVLGAGSITTTNSTWIGLGSAISNNTLYNTNNGTLSAGQSGIAGKTTVNGSYVQGSSGSLAIMIQGTNQSTSFSQGNTYYSTLLVSNGISLAGNLLITVAGQTPNPSNSYTILTAGTSLTNSLSGSNYVTVNGTNEVVAVDGYNFFRVSNTATSLILNNFTLNQWVGGGNWGSGSNAVWSVIDPNASLYAADFSTNGGGGAVTLNQNRTVFGLAFSDATNAYNLTASGGATLTLTNSPTGPNFTNSSILVTAGSQTVNVPILLGAGMVISDTAGGTTLTLGGNISQAVSGIGITLATNNVGLVYLGGSNSFSGVTVVNAGVLDLGTTNALSSASITSANLSVASNGTVLFAVGGPSPYSSNQIAAALTGGAFLTGSTLGYDSTGTNYLLGIPSGGLPIGSILLAGSGTFTVSQDNSGITNGSTVNGLNLVGGTLVVTGTTSSKALGGSNNPLYVGGTTALAGSSQLIDLGSTTQTLGNLVNANANGGTLTLTNGSIVIGAATTVSLSGINEASNASITAGGLNLSSYGGGSQAVGSSTLSGSNSFSTQVYLQGGSLSLNNSNALGGTPVLAVYGNSTLTSAGGYTNPATLQFQALGGPNITVSGVMNFGSSTLQLGGVLAPFGANFNVTSNSIMTITGGITGSSFNGGGALTNSGAGTLVIGTGDTSTNGITEAGGVLDLNGTTFTNTFTLSGGTIQNGTISNTSTFTTLTNGEVSAVLAGNVGLTQTGVGTLALSGVNTYTGVTTVNGGAALNPDNTNSLYGANTNNWTTANIIVQSNGILAFGVGTQSGAFLAGSTLDAIISNLTNTSGNTGGFLAGSFLGLDVSGTNFTQPYVFSDSGNGSLGLAAIANDASGTLTLSVSNSYTGGTVVGTNATIVEGAAGALGSANGLLSNNGVVNIAGFATAVGGLTGSGLMTNSTGGITLLTLTTTGTQLFSGSIVTGGSGDFSLLMNGAGTQTFSGSNTYTGATIITNGGTLMVTNGAIYSPNGIVTVGQGSLTIAGTGTVTAGEIIATNGNTVTTNFSAVVITHGGTLVTSNSTTAAQVSLASNTTAWSINGNWIMNGGTNNVDSTATLFPGSVYIGNNIPSNQVTVNTGGVWSLGTNVNTAASGTNNLSVVIGNSAAGSNNTLLVNGGTVTNVNAITLGGVTADVNERLIITNGGLVSIGGPNGYGNTALSVGGSNNSITIGDTNSSGNSILNLDSSRIVIGGAGVYGNNSMTVGQGGIVTNSVFFIWGVSNSLVVTNGGLYYAVSSSTIGREATGATLLIGSSTGTNSIYNAGNAVFNVGGGDATFVTNWSLSNMAQIGQGGILTNVSGLQVGGNISDTNQSANQLIVTNGGQLSTINASYIGFSTNDNSNSITIAGTNSSGGNSLWNANAGVIIVGYTNYGTNSANALNVLNGGILTNAGLITLENNNSSFNLSGAAYASGVNLSTNTASLNFSSSGTTNGVLVATASGNLIYGTGTVTFNGNGTINSGTYTVTNSASGTGTGGLTKIGSGVLLLSGTNSYAGATVVSGGELEFQNTGALYAGSNTLWTAANITVNSNATVVFGVGSNSNAFNTSNVTTLLAGIDGVVTNNGLEAGSSIGFDASGTNFVLTNTLADSTGTGGGSVALVSLGAGTLTLANSNSYSGGTILDSGTVAISNNYAFGTGSVSFASNSTVLSLANMGISNNFSIASNATAFLTETSGTSLTNYGVISGAGTFEENGAGTLVLAASNSYTNATIVNAGTLVLATNNAIGATPGSTNIDLNMGATLQINAGVTNTFATNLYIYIGNTAGIGTTMLTNAGTLVLSNWVTAIGNGGGNTGLNELVNSGVITNAGGDYLTVGYGATGTNVLNNTTSGIITSPIVIIIGHNAAALNLFTNSGVVTMTNAGYLSFGFGGAGASLNELALGAGTFTMAGSGAVNFGNASGTNTTNEIVISSGATFITSSNSPVVMGATYNNGGALNLFTNAGTANIGGALYVGDTAGLTNIVSIGSTGTFTSTYSGGVVLGYAASNSSGFNLFTNAGSSSIQGNMYVGESAGLTNMLAQGSGTLAFGSGIEMGLSNGVGGTFPAFNEILLNGGLMTDNANTNIITLGYGSIASGTNLVSVSGTGTLTGFNIFVGYGGSQTNILTNSGGMINTFDLYVGMGSSNTVNTVGLGSGTITMNTNGVNNCSLVIGGSSTNAISTASTNSLMITGGVLNSTNAITYIGLYSLSNNNVFEIDGGAANLSTISIGAASAKYTNGASTITVAGNTNQFILGGGTLTANGFVLSAGSTAAGDFNSITFNGGTLAAGVSTNNFLNIGTSQVTINSGGGTIAPNGNSITITNVIGGVGALTVNTNGGSGTLTLSASNSYSGGTVISADTLKLGNANALGSTNGELTLSAGIMDMAGFNEDQDGFTGSGTVSNSVSGTSILTVGVNNSSSTFSGKIVSGTGALALVHTGTGTLTLTGSNSYTGGTTVQQGTLAINNVNALGSGVLQLASNSVFQYIDASSDSFENAIEVTSGTGFIENFGGGDLTLAGSITKQNSILEFAGGQFNVTGQISGGTIGDGFFNSDVILSNAVVTFSTNNNYYGPTYLQAGSILQDGIANALPSSTILNIGSVSDLSTVTNGFDLKGYNQTIAGLTNAGSATALVYDSMGGGTLTITGNSGFSGSIGGGAMDSVMSLVIAGPAATVTLTGNNTYVGNTVITNGSYLDLGATGQLSGTTNVVINGSTLLLGGATGTGKINPINTNAVLTMNGGTLSMGGLTGTTRTASQTFASLTLTGNSTIDYSSLTGTSSLTFGSITMSGKTLTVLNYDQYGSTTHLYDSAGPVDSGVNLASIGFYSGSTTTSGFIGLGQFNGNEIIAVPEPGVIVAALLLIAWLLFPQGRKLARARRLQLAS